jgi:rhodanese-related sulfurtransferase
MQLAFPKKVMKNILVATVLIAAFGLTTCRSAPTTAIDSPLVVAKPGVNEITPVDARPGIEAAYSQFVDIRTPEEYAEGHAYRARNIPFESLMSDLSKLEKNEPVYLIDQGGERSREAAEMLVKAGFYQAVSIAGGMTEWEAAGLPVAR